MTSPEHTLVGIHFAIATGIHRIVGWRGVAMAGVIVIAKRNAHLSQTSWLTIATLCGYLVVRGWIRGAFTP